MVAELKLSCREPSETEPRSEIGPRLFLGRTGGHRFDKPRCRLCEAVGKVASRGRPFWRRSEGRRGGPKRFG